MSRDWRLYLADIRTACDKVLQFTESMERSEFFADERTYKLAHSPGTPVALLYWVKAQAESFNYGSTFTLSVG